MKIYLILILLVTSTISAQIRNELRGNNIFFLNETFGAIIKEGGAIAITEDGAQNWNQVIITTEIPLRKILFTSETNGWLLCEDCVYNTVDGGRIWLKNSSFENEHLYSLYFINNDYGFIGGQGSDQTGYESVIYKTQNSGQTWERATLDTNFYSGVIDFSFMNDSMGIAIDGFTIYKTENAGSSWVGLPIYFYTGAISPSGGKMLNNLNYILTAWYPIVVAEGKLYSTSDGGINWDGYGNRQNFKWGIRDEYIMNKDSIWLTTGFKTYRTTDAAQTWDTLDVELDSFSFITSNIAYGISGTSLLYTADGWHSHSLIDSAITSIISNESLPTNYDLYQNYPNPFNPSTIISFSIPQTSEIKIILYNSIGEQIKLLAANYYSAGKHEFTITADYLPSGVYFYSLQTDDYFACKKMILLK
ncbi:MAG: T9SS type A sorting domain-containing protein [Bacteroidetes bacterium]|nr:T9SS type A sorting domain-containing protein [Bacteroidota bacterium]